MLRFVADCEQKGNKMNSKLIMLKGCFDHIDLFVDRV